MYTVFDDMNENDGWDVIRIRISGHKVFWLVKSGAVTAIAVTKKNGQYHHLDGPSFRWTKSHSNSQFEHTWYAVNGIEMSFDKWKKTLYDMSLEDLLK